MSRRNFFVVVSQLGSHGKVDRELSGRLWASDANSAEIEVGKYREELNYADVWWMGDDFHIVMVCKENEARQMKGHTKWWNNRVTLPGSQYPASRR